MRPTPTDTVKPLQGRRSVIILVLGLLSAVGPFSIDMYLPGFPTMARDLRTSIDAVSYSLSSFFIGISLGQLICGPLLDRYGRKRPLYIGLVIYVLASLGCAVAESVEWLILLRLVQALGCCVSLVAPRAVVRDLFPVEESVKVFSLLILILGVSPIIAPTAGGLLIAVFGWHSVFVVLALIGLLLIAAIHFGLPESKGPDPEISLRLPAIWGAFTRVWKHPQFFTYSMAGAVAGAGLFAYLSGSPFVFMNIYGLTEQQYGWIFAIIAAGLITSSQLNNWVVRRWSSEQTTLVVLAVQTGIGALLVIGTAMNWLNLYSTVGLMFLFLSCQGFTFPNAAALSMAPFTREAGSASALMGALGMGAGAIAAALVGVFSNGTAMPLVIIMAVCAALGLLILLWGRSAKGS